jgi:pyruvate dehydrogenase E1 component alpha subunit
MEAAITREDCVITSYREHCNQLARGDTPHRIIAEMMSRATGSTKGKGGSMHYYLSKNGFYGGHGIVGAQITLGTGLAFALKYQKKPNVCFTLYGDGSANQGQLFESANMAGLWKLPVIYTIENNHWGMGSSEHKTSFHHPLYSKFRSFPGLKSEGYDIFTVREIVKASKNYALNNGPLFLEFDTYRYQGHSMSDSGLTYRTKDDVTKVRETKDCINKIKSYILEFKVATENDLKGIEREIRENLAKDVEKCKSDPLPDPSELTTEVYIEKPAFIRGVEYHNSVFNDHKQ